MKIIVLYGYGLNCEKETAFAFIECSKKMNMRNIQVKIIHINDVIDNPHELMSSHILAIPGGFSYGDHTGAGNALALHMQHNIYNELQEFIAQDKLIIGICNGCQVLIKLIEEFSHLALIPNDIGNYQCRWIKLKANLHSNSIWLRNINELYLPIAHGEGQFFMTQNSLEQLVHKRYDALRYVDDLGQYANMKFPDNPNGSIHDIAAISDKSGRILALMPHPERGIFFTQQDNWSVQYERNKRLGIIIPKYGDGMAIFENGIKYFMTRNLSSH
ncbi:phosphoribosylformylglycinamidine synthase subunit PurQ [Wolbachia endosymbiont of Howardula sp.]|uniref:phosphoribosylformylglycinamidine synthase subunit PurQ n=1 Tax=Wolbachia endosymbiont of Howardula sp. TaxID=2916816 RepID=UPI00217DDF2E|nr:phosphoribosylformylglycinamidine synthase subunit PurQ [Wolbachia endosymbiont of Howardula sp.]UWI83200.1 phosphoribosylformylglycinamidine synthase subunit PurQ [Wolbachia endosymbiont of Howardula sp.]